MKNILVLGFFLAVLSCNTEPKKIDYGKEACVFCKMNIVDAVHGAELVTKKGKIYTFDSAECMIHFLRENTDTEFAYKMTNYYESPGDFVPVEEAVFLVSDNFPSPMGAGITAFKTKEEAQKIQEEKTGEIFTFEQLQKNIK